MPDFDPNTTEYTANTSNATNKITAQAAEGTDISILVNGTQHTNGASATWTPGKNIVTITASAESAISKTYVINVVKG